MNNDLMKKIDKPEPPPTTPYDPIEPDGPTPAPIPVPPDSDPPAPVREPDQPVPVSDPQPPQPTRLLGGVV